MKRIDTLLDLKWVRLLLFLFIPLLQACEDPFSIAMHEPISPAPGDAVTYTLEMLSGKTPQQVRLYERTTTLTLISIPILWSNIEFLLRIPGPEVQLQTWTNPSLGTLSFRRTGIPQSCLVTYRFEIVQSNNVVMKHEVTYASRDYPLQNDPVPVYITGDAKNTFDVVYIPDTDITNLNTFRTHCRNDIRDAFFDENTTKTFRHSFNFYINRQTGHATDYDRISTDGQHQTPSNYSHLSFAEGKVLLHQNDLRDYASGGLYSAEMQNRGTIMHESGHGLFGLADEYAGGAHWQAPLLPNNWSSKSGAEGAAPSRHKSTSDVQQMGTTGWYKICDANCQMLTTGLTHDRYDAPCADRVSDQLFTISTK